MEFGIFLTFLLHTPTMKHDDDDTSFLNGVPFSVLQTFRDQVSSVRPEGWGKATFKVVM